MSKRDARKPKENGYIIHETERLVVIATGFDQSSANAKTGSMLQTWILVKDVDPVTAVATGMDHENCFNCPYANGNGCYVQVGNAPLSVYKKYRRGGYSYLVDLSLVRGRKFRFGSYGEPIVLPIGLVRAIANASEGWTGYTHQWRELKYLAYRDFFMASTSEHDYADAKALGWRAFSTSDDADTGVMCPASKEYRFKILMAIAYETLMQLPAAHSTKQMEITCASCGACSGNLKKTGRGLVRTTQKDFRIALHGAKKGKAKKALKGRFVPSSYLTPVAYPAAA